VANGTGGFAINGEAEGNGAGFSVSGAGDVNGDGKDDLIVSGSYVVFGKADNSSVELSDVRAGTGGFAINGERQMMVLVFLSVMLGMSMGMDMLT
jgi:hypothetical protein